MRGNCSAPAYLVWKLFFKVMLRRFTVSNLNNFQQGKIKKYLLVGIGVLVIIFVIWGLVSMMSKGSVQGAATKADIAPPIKTVELNKEFNFSLKDEKNAEIGKIKYIIENAELRDQIVVQGKRATAIEGRQFLVLNLKIVNDNNKTIGMQTRDYLRLSVNGNENELLAPDIHNDPVVVQAISTKYTRIGFPINESDKNLKLKVGEIKGDKQTLDLNF